MVVEQRSQGTQSLFCPHRPYTERRGHNRYCVPCALSPSSGVAKRIACFAIILLTLLLTHPAHAQIPNPSIPNGNWWRGCASLDLDFYNDRYYINNNTDCSLAHSTTGTTYSGAAYGTNVQNFITATGATFTRAGSTTTANSNPFYLSSIQTFLSRASVTNNVTSTIAPFYNSASQSWVSRADGGVAKATYFDNTGTLQTAAAGTARNAAYYYSGGSWVTASANTIAPQTISSITDSSGTATVTTGAAHGLAVGNSVTLANNYPSNYNGTFTVASVPSSTTFTYTMSTDPGVNASQTGNYTTTATTPAVLIEPAATNYIRNNTMQGAVAADGVERTNNGTFSTTSPNVCSGTDNSSGSNLSCSNGTAITAQSISSIAYTSTTATVTTGAAHGLAIGNVVTIAGVTGTSAADYNGTFMVKSVPNSTSFTYIMVATPTSTATITGASYTATTGGWAGTVNGGTGSITAARGSVTLTGDGSNAAELYQEINTTVGLSYTVIVTTGAGNSVSIVAGQTTGTSSTYWTITDSASSTIYYNFTAATATSYIQINNTSTTAATVTSVSVQFSGTQPTDWAFQDYAGFAFNIIGTGTEEGIPYIDVQCIGTAQGSNAEAIYFDNGTAATASIGQTWTNSFYVRVPSGSTTNVNSITGLQQFFDTGATGSGSTNSTYTVNVSATTLSSNRVSTSFTVTNPAAAYGKAALAFSVSTGKSINVTFRIGMPQFEATSYMTTPIPTSGSSVTRAADVYNQQPASYINSSGTLNFALANTARVNYNATSPYALLGTLIEPAATNSIRNNMMAGAVAADGQERTSNGSFSNTSPNVCSGSVTSSTSTLACSNGTINNPKSISAIAYSGSTITVTTSVAHLLAVGNIITMSGVGGTSAASFNGAFMVVSVPSTTTFTYTAATAPTAAATITGASYTATAGGWAGTVNGGTGSITAATGSMTLTGDGTNAASIYMAIPVTSLCSIDISVTTGSGGAVTIQAGTSIGGSSTLAATSVAASTTTHITTITAGTINYIQINNTSATAATVTSVSIQSAGCPSTDWTNLNAAPGLSASVLDTGTINGINYEDIKVTGTTTSAALALNLGFETSTQIAAASGQTWTESFYLALISGTIPNYIYPAMTEKNSSGNDLQYDTGSTNLASSLTSTLTRYTYTKTLSNSSTAYVEPGLWVGTTGSGQTVNFTIRVAMPQLEQSSYATSAIPTFGSAVTRSADVYAQPVGTYYNSTGVLTTAASNTPRMDSNPSACYTYNSATVCPPQGILVEEGRTNLVAYSVPDGGTSWTYSTNNTVGVAAAAASPDGTASGTTGSAASLADNSTSGSHYAVPTASLSFTSGTSYTFSVFAKASTATVLQLNLPSGEFSSTAYADFNLSAGTVTATGSGITASGIQALGNSWYRCYITAAATSTASDYPAIALTNNVTTATAEPSYSGSGKLLYIWGADVEAGSFPTSYIPTSGATITRQADVFTLPVSASGTNGAWYNAGVGTLLTTSMVPVVDGTASHRFAQIDDGTFNNIVTLTASSTSGSSSDKAAIYSGGTAYYNISSVATVANSPIRGAISYSSSSGTAYAAFAGTSYGSGSSITVPTVTILNVGSANRGANYFLDGWDQRITYFPIQQPNASLPQF